MPELKKKTLRMFKETQNQKHKMTKTKLSLQDFRAWAIRHGYRETRTACFEKTNKIKAKSTITGEISETGEEEQVRLKYTSVSICKEKLAIIPVPTWDSKGKPTRMWFRAASAYTRDVSITPEDKLAGLSAKGCNPFIKENKAEAQLK